MLMTVSKRFQKKVVTDLTELSLAFRGCCVVCVYLDHFRA